MSRRRLMWKKVRRVIVDLAVGFIVCVLLGQLSTFRPAGYGPGGQLPPAGVRLAQDEPEAPIAAPPPSASDETADVEADSGPTPVPDKGAERTALLIGIDRAAGGIPLEGAVTDVENTYAALLRYGFRVEDMAVLTDGEATRERILDELGSLDERTAAGGTAVFLFAGHSGTSKGVTSLRTAEGSRIRAPELALALGAVRARMWVALPTCNAGGYALPGVVGPNRVATFASSAAERSYELGAAGSYMIRYMVEQGMLEGKAAASVEDAFHYARYTIERSYPNRVPSMSDGIPGGELALGLG